MSDKPLKPYRSEAEKIRVRQGYVLICLNLTNVTIAGLVLLKTFHVI
jgi:hypothetical protein